jgi:hypothetical protein
MPHCCVNVLSQLFQFCSPFLTVLGSPEQGLLIMNVVILPFLLFPEIDEEYQKLLLSQAY